MSDSSRILAAGLAVLVAFVAGCSKRTTPQKPSANTPNQPQSSEAESDLAFLHHAFTDPRYGKTPERLPKDLDEAAPSIKVIDHRIFDRVKRGLYVVRWGVPLAAPVLAYEKDAPTTGGWVLRGGGRTEKMSADQLNQQLAQKDG